MESLHHALILDGHGRPTSEHELVRSKSFDEIRNWTEKVYMPYAVRPLGRRSEPDSILHAANIGGMILSRFSYGIPVHVSDFCMGPGMGMVLTTVRGAARHWIDTQESVDTPAGHSFLVDTGRTDYWADFDRQALQINITFPHQYLEELFLRWYGVPAEAGFWRRKVTFGGPSSSWIALLHYACRCVAEQPEQVRQGSFGLHLQEMLGMHMLSEWIRRSDARTASIRAGLAPRYVKMAEEYMQAHAREAPTLSQIAREVGVSVRTLTNSFRQFRSYTANDFLREQRLQGLRKALLSAPRGTAVVAVGSLWGFASMGIMAAVYFRRFGEYPSETINRLRCN